MPGIPMPIQPDNVYRSRLCAPCQFNWPTNASSFTVCPRCLTPTELCSDPASVSRDDGVRAVERWRKWRELEPTLPETDATLELETPGLVIAGLELAYAQANRREREQEA